MGWIRRIGGFLERRIELVFFVVFGECRHRYAVSSLMDTAYCDSEEEDDSKKDEFFSWLSTTMSEAKTEKLGQESGKLYAVEPAEPVPSAEVCLKVKLEPDEWIKDSGCSRNMTGNKDLFSTCEAINGGNVVFGSYTKSKIIVKGQICDKKFKALFSETSSEFFKDSITIGRGIRKNGLYIKKMGNSPKDSLCLASIDDTSTLWHRRSAHANMRFIKSLSSKEFEMSMMGELNFYLGLQIKQLEDGIFFNRSKYIKEMLKKFGLEDSKPIKTPMTSEIKLTQDEDGESVDDTKYHGMIGILLYLTSSLPDIMFSICLCACFQEDPKTSHLEADNVQKGNISIEKVSFEDNIADILTKPLKREPFNLLRLGLGLKEPNT
ncbi:retrovirus-related pol polyprotein from transposon TNT 1-94 [Tanacetum coccineum]